MRPSLVCAGPAQWAWKTFDKLAATFPDRYVLAKFCTERELQIAAETLKPIYLFFLNWSGRVPETITNQFECVNFHCTPLPYGRGGHPIENMILAGNELTLITAHRMTSEVDAGPIYMQSDWISLAGHKAMILERFIEPVAAMIETLDSSWRRGVVAVPQPQHGEAFTFKRLPPDVYAEFWSARERHAH